MADWKTPEIEAAIKERDIMTLAGEEHQGNVHKGTTEGVAKAMLEDSNFDHAIEFMKDDSEWIRKARQKLALQLAVLEEYSTKVKVKA